MKKIYTTLVLLAAVSFVFVSCEREPAFDDYTLGKNEVAILLRGAAPATKSVGTVSPKTVSFPIETTADGQALYLEQTIEDLNDGMVLETKGTPVYTENLGDLYPTIGAVAAPSSSFNMNKTGMVEGGWRYVGGYSFTSDDPVNFYFRAPVDMAESGVSNLVYTTASNKPVIEFNYTSKDNASAQKDIIFAARSISKADVTAAAASGGVPVLFHHALSAVKFRIVNNTELTEGARSENDNKTQTYITSVKFIGLKNSGHCVVTPRMENGEYVDDPTGDYSSGDASTVVWTPGNTTGDFTQTFDPSTENIVTFNTSSKFTNNGKYPDSFAEAGNTNNLNDGDATLTFWFIPQTVSKNVQLEVKYKIWDGKTLGEEKTVTVEFGDILSKQSESDQELTRNWKAGQLRTFSLKPQHFDVNIEEEFDQVTKSNVEVRNTGNIPEYVRCLIVANWVDENDHIVYGYTTETGMTAVVPWALTSDGSGANYGTFSGLPGSGWEYRDGYYYYTSPLGPGEGLSSAAALFTSYTYTSQQVPDIWLPVKDGREAAVGVHLVMDIAVQAIETKGEDGVEYADWEEAWADKGLTVQDNG